MTETFYQEIAHTADWALRIWTKDYAELFVHAAQAMFERMGVDVNAATTVEHVVIIEDAVAYEVLLIAWLNELLFLSEDHEAMYTAFQIHQLTPDRLQARVHGYQGRASGIKIKAATFYDVSILEQPGRLETTLTFDV